MRVLILLWGAAAMKLRFAILASLFLTSPVLAQVVRPAQDVSATQVDSSGTVTTGGVAQNGAPADTSRRYLLISNPSKTLEFWFNTTAAAGNGTAGSIYVAPGGAFIFDKMVPTGAVSIYGATTGQPYTIKVY